MSNSMRTIVLKLHKPSMRKKEIIDEAMLNYTLAFQYLLDKAQIEIEDIKSNYLDEIGKFNAKNISKWIGSTFNQALNEFNVEPFKDSLKIDFASTMAGYLNSSKLGQFPEYPNVYISHEMLNYEYDKYMDEYINGIEETELSLKKINRLVKKSERLRPIFFCRYATNRNYCLLYDVLKNKYFAKIYLMNSTNSNRKNFDKNTQNVIRYVNTKKELFKIYGKKEGFLILPLSFGSWQEKYLKQAIEKPQIIKTARLFKRKNEYYLSINIEVNMPVKIESNKYMGISRGVENTINYSVVNISDDVEKYGFEKMSNTIEINTIHVLANRLVEVATNDKCQVVMEKLVDRGDKLSWIDENGVEYKAQLGCYEYNRLYDILKYKLPAKGLPPPIRVSSTGIFHTCPRCGFNSRENRFHGRVLMCILCGMSLHIEEAGSINLAKKLNKYNKELIEIKSEKTTCGIKFINKDLELEYFLKSNSYDSNMLVNEIEKVIKSFYENIKFESTKKSFNKKYGIIKKIEGHGDILKCFKITQT